MIALLLLSFGLASAQPAPEQVTMSLQEFLKLYEATKDRPTEVKAPVAFTLSSAQYNGQVLLDGGQPASALFRARFRIENLQKRGEWVRVPLLPGTVAVRSATLAGRPAPILLEGNAYKLVTDRTGTIDIEVEFAAAVTTRDGSSGFSFPLMPSGATELVLSVPASDALDFTIANAKLKSDRRLGGNRIVEATLPASGQLAVSWQREISEADAVRQEPRIYSQVDTLVGVGDGLLTARVTLQQSVLFAGVDTFRARIPEGMTVLDVQGAGLREWAVDDEGVMTAQLNYAAEGAYALAIELERLLGDATDVAVPVVVPLGVERAKGFVGVQPRSNVELTAGALTGAAPVDVRTLPASIVGVTGQPVLLGFKYLGAEAGIPLSVGEHEEVDVLVTLLDQADATTMFTADGRRLTSVRYQVRNNRRQFLRLALPDGASLWSASVGGRSVQPAMSEGRLLIPLVRSQASGGSLAAFGVEVVYVEDGEAPARSGRGTFEARLPAADAPTTYVGWTVYAPHEAKIKRKKIEGGSLRYVRGLSRPMPAAQAYEVPAENVQMQRAAQALDRSGGLGSGAAPVEVRLPVDGQPLTFEKLLALDEALWVTFDYKGLK